MIEEMIIELKIIRGAIYLKTLSRGLEEKYFIYVNKTWVFSYHEFHDFQNN